MRRLGQALVLVLMAICAVGTGAFIAIAVYYHRFSTDIGMAAASVPATVLSPAAGTLEQAQVTLVRGPGGGAVLLRTVPRGRTTAFLSIPRSAILAGEPVGRLDTSGLVRGLSTTTGIGISHVAIVGDPVSDRTDRAEQRVLRDFAGRTLAPTSVTQLRATGRAMAETATDLTAADVLGLGWLRLDDRQVVECAFAEHQTVGSAKGHAIAATFLGKERSSACPGHAIEPASVVPPQAVVVLVQEYGTWVFIVIAAAATLISLGAAALFARMRLGAATTGPVSAFDAAVSGRMSPVTVSRVLAGAGSSIRRVPAGAAATVDVSVEALGRMGATVSALSRVGVPRVRAMRRRVSRWHAHGRGRAVTLMGGGPWVDPRYRSRVRRFAYRHQDAVWIAVFAAVGTGVLIRLLSA